MPLFLLTRRLMTESDPASRPVLVLDFGAQYVQLIARRVRERHAFARIVRHDITADRVRELDPLAVILSGGPASVYEPAAPQCDPALFDLDIPILGICYGMQLDLRGAGRPGPGQPGPGEFGRAECRVLDENEPLFHDVPQETIVWMSHGDQIHDAGGDFLPLAATPTCPIAAVRHRDRPIYGLQFHPEVSHTPYGSLILGNFLDRICGNPRTWTMDAFIERSLAELRAQGRAGRPGRLRALRRRRFGGLCGPAGPGPGPSGRLRLRRQRDCCAAASAPRSAEAFGATRTPSCGSSTRPRRS